MPASAQGFPNKASLQQDHGIDLDVYQCALCGVVQVNCEPVSYYRDVIRAAAVSDEMRQFRLQQFGQLAAEYGLSGKKVVEIGCGKGEYLSLINQCGMNGFGLENNDASVRFCSDLELQVHRGFVDHPDARIPNAPYSAFFILSYLEHVPELNGMLQGISNNLEPDGLGLVEVPNFDKIIRENLFSEFIADHIFYFTRDTLKTTLERNGYSVLDCRTVWYDYIISAVVRKKSPVDVSRFLENRLNVQNELHAYIDQFSSGKVAVWGAGHQSLSVIALTGIASKISYVVDSAAFKQNKFTPATHISIFAPDKLRTDPVESVIIMAASYSNEVAGILRKEFSPELHIAILRESGLEIVA